MVQSKNTRSQHHGVLDSSSGPRMRKFRADLWVKKVGQEETGVHRGREREKGGKESEEKNLEQNVVLETSQEGGGGERKK